MRDQQLNQAKVRKEIDLQEQRDNEIQIVTKLKGDIEKEKQGILEKKRREREICQ